MRIIAGKFRSRQLRSLKSTALRPTSDRLRETLFNILGDLVAGSRFIDAFAGTGAVGIEALSRGAKEVIFIEKHPATAALIKKNLESLQIQKDEARVLPIDVLHALERLARENSGSREVRDILFLDPPYDHAAEYDRVLSFLGSATLLHDGALVIAAGGGGIPVVRRQGILRGIEAVIDKDRASALLALRLGVDLFAILTDEDFVYLDYKRLTQRPLTRVTAAELEAYYRAGHFPPGNMGPKVESVLRFLRGGGIEAVITSQEHLREAVAGRAGTRIIPDGAAGAELQEPCEVHVGGR